MKAYQYFEPICKTLFYEVHGCVRSIQILILYIIYIYTYILLKIMMLFSWTIFPSNALVLYWTCHDDFVSYLIPLNIWLCFMRACILIVLLVQDWCFETTNVGIQQLQPLLVFRNPTLPALVVNRYRFFKTPLCFFEYPGSAVSTNHFRFFKTPNLVIWRTICGVSKHQIRLFEKPTAGF